MILSRYLSPIVREPFDLRIDRLFDDALDAVGGLIPTHPFPWNVYQEDDWLWVEAAVPGLTAKDVEVTIKDGVLTMSVTRPKRQEKEDRRTYLAQEIGWDKLTRSMRVPDYVDVDKVLASCKDGILSLGLPKLEKAQARQIPIEESAE